MKSASVVDRYIGFTMLGVGLSLGIAPVSSVEAKLNDVQVKVYDNVCGPGSDYYKRTGRDCGIKKVRIETRNNSDILKGDRYPMYATQNYAGFEARSWKDLGEYGFVQYIRGCTYVSRKGRDGRIERDIVETINHLDQKRMFVMPHWSFDANTTDPLYYGPVGNDARLPGGRLSLYHWAPDLRFSNRTQPRDYYEMLRLPMSQRESLAPILYVKDMPSAAYYAESENGFMNVSLEYRICLYPLHEIPEFVTSDRPIPAEPILCHAWDSQFEFDHNQNQFVHRPGKGLDSFCATQEPLQPGEALRRSRGYGRFRW